MRLLRIARSLIEQVNSGQLVIDHWTLGGGTAMMLQIGHRESHDIDIFFNDPQFLPFLDLRMHDFEFEIEPSASATDGTRSLKIAFDKIGEIDFIVAPTITSSPTTSTHIDGEAIVLETVPEIIAKKICYRGSMIRPRDIFDIAAAGERHEAPIVEALKNHRGDAMRALAAIDRLNVDFVSRAIAQLSIRPEYEAISRAAIAKSKELLRAI
jgi:Nucleotidyl transferase AbiEii toxin, Type IV TA system